MIERVRLALFALLVAASLAGAQGHVHTSRSDARRLPLPKEDGVWHFAIYGDRTGGPPEGIEVLRQAVSDTNLLDPDLVMTVGDLVQGYNATEQWMEQVLEFRGVMDGLRMPWFPVAGNHDIYWRGAGRPGGEHEGNYERHFGPLWYWFPHKDAAFFVLYSDEGDPETGRKSFSDERCIQMSPEQLQWLERSLADAGKARHVFLFLHHPRWLGGRYPKNNWDAVHRVLVKAGNVDAVFAGHIHQMVYDGKRDGIEYFALATTGGALSRTFPGAGWLHHLNVVTVRDAGISVSTIPVGAVIDPREITTERVAEINALLKGVWPREAAVVELGFDGSATGDYRCALRNPTQSPIEVTVLPEADDGTWSFGPDHAHLAVPAGEARELSFRYRRPAGCLDSLELPQLVMRVDYLGEGLRLALPEQRRAVGARLVGTAPKPRANGALDLDGRGSCARVAPEMAEVANGPLTLEGWIFARELSGRRPFLAKTESSEFGIFVNNGIPEFSIHLGGRYRVVGSAEPVLETGRWHHVAGVFDGEEIRLYVDGHLRAHAPASGKRRRNRLPLFVGADPNKSGDPVDHLDGMIDEVRLSRCARYTGERFRPARRHQDDEETVLLLHLDASFGPFLPDDPPRRAAATRIGNASCVEVEVEVSRISPGKGGEGAGTGAPGVRAKGDR